MGTALIFSYSKVNRISYNVLLGALEKWNIIDSELDIKIVSPKEVTNTILSLKKKGYEKIILAVSFMTTQVFEIIHLISSARMVDPSIILIAGGPHPSGDPIGTILLGFDFVIIGEGEITFPRIIERIKNNEDPTKERGLFFYNGNKFKFTEKQKEIDLNEYPPFSLKFKKFNPIEITRGCPFACFYCQTSYMFSKKVRHRSIENILRYISIMNNLGLRDVRFISPNAFSYGSINGRKPNIRAIEELLEGIRGIIGPKGRIFFGTFPSEVRPEFVSEDILEVIKKYVNNDNLIIGAQSGSQRVLDIINRGHTIEDIYKAVSLSTKYNFTPNVDFIFGLPGETEADVNNTLKVMKDLIKMGARIHAHTFLPLVGTPFSKKPPGYINKKIKRILGKLALEGKLYGEWASQELEALKIHSYYALRNRLLQEFQKYKRLLKNPIFSFFA
ncbi:MAG: TIGR04013 family B12-binding domain/radical SAM domain-containing protein [Candidatus Odinarchaeota archaeon]|nr:TIGR04013 family B12-binding domain/radical SAM domain-containing protein [Candidatus Odinarchaeota archaeon]